MTGFALARSEYDGWAVRMSVKSVNHRFLDVKLRMPEGFDLYEAKLRQVVREKVQRGHVEVQLNIQPSGAAPLQINRELARAYLQAAEELRRQADSKADVDVLALLRLPGVVAGVAPAVPESEEEQERLGGALMACLADALVKLEEMRRIEGQHLAEDLRGRAGRISEQAGQIRELAVKLQPSFHKRLETRLKELLSGTGLEPARIAQEAALLAERSDISEELDRLRSHLTQFGQLLDGGGETGKKLDFLLQEMHREANTLLSKTPGVESEGLAITGLALEIKAEIEKLREQVQNIE
jgi:uncharacterized protein (TIGR00255 family)